MSKTFKNLLTDSCAGLYCILLVSDPRNRDGWRTGQVESVLPAGCKPVRILRVASDSLVNGVVTAKECDR